ncbi:hypothetical protein NB537_22200 [Vibrio parahaemolyticus]|nr:hypothetical protein [Vibrio parahaemolyticus]MCR9657479.1 hypothetical protein [Vibrio parahaemolyticus]
MDFRKSAIPDDWDKGASYLITVALPIYQIWQPCSERQQKNELTG